MYSIRTLGLATAVVGFFGVATAARADDATTTKADNDQCIDQCIDNCAEKCPASASGVIKKTTKSTMRVVKPAQPKTTQADLDAIRAEERARAAEEFRSANENMMEEHRGELDKARAEERDLAAKKTEADIAQARADEDRKYRSEIMKRDQQLAMAREKEPIIKSALLTPVGIYGYVGGGVTNFTEPEAVGATTTGGYWDARLGVGTRSILGGEVAYVGGARDVDALGLNNSAFLVNNGLEGVARLNVPITTNKVLVEPYTFGGVGWQHYNLASETTNTSDVQDSDDIMTVPLGLGLAFGFSGFTLDARATYRHAVFSDLLGNSTSSFDSESLNSWGAGAALGFEF